MPRARSAPLLILALLAIGAQTTAARAEATPPWRLANGLEVILTPLPEAKRTALVLVLRVGEHHDPVGRSGLSHLVEHCFVTAAAGTCAARSAETLAARYPDGSTAQTADLHTTLGFVFPPERLGVELEHVAARLGALAVTAEDLAREKPRVLAEVANMFGAMPALGALNRARERVLPSPSGGRRAGLPAHVEALTLEDVVQHARRHYTAGNAVLSVAGAFDAGALRAQIETLFGALPRGERPSALPRPTERPTPRVDVVRQTLATGEAARACLAFAAPAPDGPDYAPFLTLIARLVDPNTAPGGFPPPFHFAPLDEPGAAYVSKALEAGEEPEAAIASLQARVNAAVSAPWSPADALRATQAYGLLLGIVPASAAMRAQNPYLAAMGPAVRHVLGMDPARLRRELVQVRSLPLGEIAARLFDPLHSGAGVVLGPP